MKSGDPAGQYEALREAAENDAAYAGAICEAVSRPNMRFVQIKAEEQQNFLILHRSHDLLMRQRTIMFSAPGRI